MITRRGVLLTGGIGLLVGHPISRAQSAETVRRVGWFSIGSKTAPHDGYAAFTQGMHDLGWTEGKNVEYRSVYADGEVRRLDALASEMVRQKVDAIVVGNATTARAFQRATKTIPIVMYVSFTALRFDYVVVRVTIADKLADDHLSSGASVISINSKLVLPLTSCARGRSSRRRS